MVSRVVMQSRYGAACYRAGFAAGHVNGLARRDAHRDHMMHALGVASVTLKNGNVEDTNAVY